MNRRTIGAWCLYDFGNSAFAVLFPAMYGAFYAEYVVGQGGERWWGYTISLSMALVALSSPLLGGIADHAGVRKRMLALYTMLALGSVLCFTAIRPGMIVRGFLLGAVANFAFEGGTVFYNAYLPRIAPKSHHGRVSARGFAVGYVGSLVALGAAAPLAAHGMIGWVWVCLAVQWAIASLPAFLFLPADVPTGEGVVAAGLRGVRETLSTWTSVVQMPDLRRFLLAYFFFMDGVNTVIVFAGVYAQKQLHFSAGALIGLLALVQVSALGGSMLLAGPTDRRGPQWAVQVSLYWWIFTVVAAYFATSAGIFWAVATLAGLGLGSIQAASRAFMSRLVPEGREAELFGFYALCGKTGAILGPLVFGAVTDAFGSQRPAVLSVVVFYVAGLLLLRRIRVSP